MQRWIAASFSLIEDIIYVGLGLLLAGVAMALLIIIFVEVLYTVQVSFRQHVLQPGPFLVVGLIAATRRILVLTAELPKMAKENEALLHNAIIELAMLTVLILALVMSLRLIRPEDVKSAAEETVDK